MSRNLERERRISLYMKLGNGSTSRGTYKRMMRIFAKKRKGNPYGLKPGVTYGPKGASKGAPRRKVRLDRDSA